MSFPGMARHIIVLRFSFRFDLGNRHAVAKENRVPNFCGAHQVEQNTFHRASNADFPNSHFTFDRYRDDFAVNQVHRISTPFGRVAADTDRAAATTWPSAIPPSLGGMR